MVPTKFASALVASPKLEELNKSRTMLGRLGTPQDMAAAVSSLLSQPLPCGRAGLGAVRASVTG